jgi:hypothetical protein
MQHVKQITTPNSRRLWRIAGFAMIAIALFLTMRFLGDQLFSEAQRPDGTGSKGTELEQCANEAHDCNTAGSSSWQTGNLNQNNSAYAEGDSVPYRATLTGLTPGETYLVMIEWDSLEGGKHAIDYLTSYTRTETNAIACDAVDCGSATAATAAIPADSSLGSVPQVAGSFSLFGATFTPMGTVIGTPVNGNLCSDGLPCPTPMNPTGYTVIDSSASSQQKRITVYFTATNSTAVLAWGGHIASQADWGVGMSASDINGSPYHMRLIDFRCTDATNCSSGNKDVSMSTTAIVTPPTTTTTTTSTTTTTTEPPTTTTAAPTTTAVATTAPPVVTTAPPVVTTAPPVVTTAPTDLQVIVPEPAQPDDLQQVFPDELASTGFDDGVTRLVAMIAMLFGAMLLTYRAFRRIALTGDKK